MPTKKTIPEEKDTQYPSIAIAYDLAVNSYEFGEKRYQAAENRGEKILGFIASLNLAIIVFLSKTEPPKLKFGFLFILAFLLGTASLIVGIWGYLKGRVAVVDISTIYQGWLHLEDEEFKNDFIIKAAEDFDTTVEQVERKSGLATLSAGLFLLETFCLMFWLIFR